MSSHTKPEISVVMGVRDGAAELPATLASLFAQREVALEVVVVDDGSRDGTPELLARTAAAEPRLRVIRQEPRGLTAALAHGCAVTRAPLLARHDCGDLSHPERLARQKAMLDAHPEVALVSCWTVCVGPQGEPLRVEKRWGEADRPLALLPAPASCNSKAGPTSHGSTLFRRTAYEAAGGYRPVFALAQDWDLWFRLGREGAFLMLGAALYLRCLLPTSLSFGAHDLQVEFAELAKESAVRRAAGGDDEVVLSRVAALANRFERERRARARRAPALGSYHLGALLRKQGDRRAAAYLAAAVRARPFDPRPWTRWAQAVLSKHSPQPPEGFLAPEVLEMMMLFRRKGSGEE